MNNGQTSVRGRAYGRSQLSRRLLAQFLLALVGWLVGFTGLCLLAWSFCNSFVWQPWDPVYRFLAFVKNYLPVFYFVPLIIGWVAISYYFLGKAIQSAYNVFLPRKTVQNEAFTYECLLIRTLI